MSLIVSSCGIFGNMARAFSTFVCQQCGYESVGWMGKCPNCGEWNTLVETIVSTAKSEKVKSKNGVQKSETINLNEIKTSQTRRISTKISELDRVLGGGLVPGQ